MCVCVCVCVCVFKCKEKSFIQTEISNKIYELCYLNIFLTL